MPTRLRRPDSLRRPAADEDGTSDPSARRVPTPPPIRRALKQRLRSRKESVPSCPRQGVACGLLRLFGHQSHRPPFFSRSGRLAVHHCYAWLRFPTGFEANFSPKDVVNLIESSVESPAPITGVYRGVLRKVSGQVAPLTPGTHQIKDRVDNFATVELRRTTDRLRSKKRCDLGSLFVGQVGRVIRDSC